ncbi:MAG TPA: tetratricopeptide repeat protein [Ignavibacteriaceae bacterium]|nr:tetratricopeptide repeat protein [Ignavibacteriaceae bacterium]
MKKFIITGSLSGFIVLTLLVTQIMSQHKSTKVTAFNASIKYESKSDFKNALSELQKIYSDNKNDYLINLRMGWIYYSQKEYQKSIDFYNKAISLNPASIEAKIGVTFPLSLLQKWDKVEELYKNILQVDGGNYTANLRLGQIYLARADYMNAKKYLEKVHNYYPGEFEPNLSLGYTFYYLGNTARAKDLFTNALMLDGDNALAKSGLNLVQ